MEARALVTHAVSKCTAARALASRVGTRTLPRRTPRILARAALVARAVAPHAPTGPTPCGARGRQPRPPREMRQERSARCVRAAAPGRLPRRARAPLMRVIRHQARAERRASAVSPSDCELAAPWLDVQASRRLVSAGGCVGARPLPRTSAASRRGCRAATRSNRRGLH